MLMVSRRLLALPPRVSSRNTIAEYHKMGLPADVVVPTGGRAMIMDRVMRAKPGASQLRCSIPP